MFSKKMKSIFSKISSVVSPGPKDIPKKKVVSGKKIKKQKTGKESMNLKKEISFDDFYTMVGKDQSITQNKYKNVINFNYLQHNPEFLVQIDSKERDIFKNNVGNLREALNMRDFDLNQELKLKKGLTPEERKNIKKEKRKIGLFASKITGNLVYLEKNSKPYNKVIEINDKPETKYESDKTKEDGKRPIPSYITNLLYDIEKMNVEFGGGYSPQLNYLGKKIPEKLVLRKFKPTESFQDTKEDLPLHTHPTREIPFYEWNQDFQDLDERINKKLENTKEERSKDRLRELKYKITSPYDYLPSKQDIKVVKSSDKTNLEVSKTGLFLMTPPVDPKSRNETLNFEFDRGMKSLMEYALVKSGLNKNFHSISQLEKRVETYNEIVIDTYKKALAENEIRSEFYPRIGELPKFIVTESESDRYNNRKDDIRYDIKKLRNKKETQTKKRFR